MEWKPALSMSLLYLYVLLPVAEAFLLLTFWWSILGILACYQSRELVLNITLELRRKKGGFTCSTCCVVVLDTRHHWTLEMMTALFYCATCIIVSAIMVKLTVSLQTGRWLLVEDNYNYLTDICCNIRHQISNTALNKTKSFLMFFNLNE